MSISFDFNANNHFILLSIPAASLAAVMAWQLNRFAAVLNNPYRVCIAPLAEEIAKTVPALLLGASIFFTHMFFGVIEAVWELLYQRRNGFYAGLAALASHSVFGFITTLVYERQETAPPAILTGYLAHAIWNYLMENLGNTHRHF